jgi:hypothetical protein
MSHIPRTDFDRHAGDPFNLEITVADLAPGSVLSAVFRAGPISKVKDSGITVTDPGGGASLLTVAIARADTINVSPKTYDWQCAAGGTDPVVVAYGTFELKPRLV